ncbi:rho guanine nucleotide exchange factor 8-like [Typha latifolia]|uniref:rho guanine nucleotide exchange factor 8-like n=1 Tax=Typha latifolia TaxID=4733 RepID=UPI003C2DC20A
MVRFLERGYSLDRFLHRRGMLEISGRKARSMIFESHASTSPPPPDDDKMMWRSQESRTPGRPLVVQQIGVELDRSSERGPRSRLTREYIGCNGQPSDMELMKEKFAKLLLGEDMSGSGKGVSSALALSNAITNLAASVFGEQRRLEPMPAERKARWRKEVDWLLSVTDHVVEFVPSQQVSTNGTNMEIMVTQQRRDLHMNIPALRKLDAMLMEYLDNFKDHHEFWYVKRDADESDKGKSQRKDDKWWLPTVKVPPDGLSEVSRKWLQYQKELVNQVLKAAMAINANVLMEMEIPEDYIDSLPKNGRASLGDSLYRSITVDVFDPEDFLASIDLSTEHKILDLKNRIEASVVIWKRKMHNKDAKSPWGSTVSLEKREQFEERAETILLILKHRFPGIPQSDLDISKIQYNKDVGYSILESYSRILESLAYTVMSQIEDVLYADSLARDPTLSDSKRRTWLTESEPATGTIKALDPREEIEKLNKMESPASFTLSDFMGWNMDQDAEVKKDSGNLEDILNIEDGKFMKKPPNIVTNKKFSYIEKLESSGGFRSPTARN